jgi:soluble cytochrome b562
MKTGYLALLSIGMSLTLGYLMAQTPPAGGPAQEKTVLAQNMQKINEARNALRDSGQLADASKNADSLAKVTTMRDAAIEAQKQQPAITATKSAEVGKTEAQFVSEYRTEIQKLIDALGEMQVALRANNNAEAERLFDVLGTIQRGAHPVYRGGRGGARGPGGQGPARGGPPGN